MKRKLINDIRSFGAIALGLFVAAPLSAQRPTNTEAAIESLVAVRTSWDSALVRPQDDAVTIVVFNSPRTFSPINLRARYQHGPWLRATPSKGIPAGDHAVTVIPWNPGLLTIGPSRSIHVDRGDIVVVTWPDDYWIGGWLGRAQP